MPTRKLPKAKRSQVQPRGLCFTTHCNDNHENAEKAHIEQRKSQNDVPNDTMINSNTTGTMYLTHRQALAWTAHTHIHNMHSPRAQCAQDRASSNQTVNSDTVLTANSESPSRCAIAPTATYMTQHVLLKLPWCPADGYRSHSTTNLASPPECRQHTNGTTQRACRWKRTIRITTHPPDCTQCLVTRTQIHDQNHCRNTRNERHGNPNVTDKHELPSTDVPALLTCTTHIHRFNLQIQTSQLPNMVALPCTCHTCTYCAHAFMNVKTTCVTSIKSLSHLANGSSLLRSVRRSVRLKCENE